MRGGEEERNLRVEKILLLRFVQRERQPLVDRIEGISFPSMGMNLSRMVPGRRTCVGCCFIIFFRRLSLSSLVCRTKGDSNSAARRRLALVNILTRREEQKSFQSGKLAAFGLFLTSAVKEGRKERTLWVCFS